MPESNPGVADNRGQYIHPLPVRVWHWINALGFVMLILTGFQIRYMDLLQLVSFEFAVKAHNWTGFIVIGNSFVWLGFYLFSDKITVYHPELNMKKFFKGFFAQMRYYGFGIFQGEHSPHHIIPHDKFNPMQSITYQIVMFLVVPVQFVTGILLWNIDGFGKYITWLGGVRVIDTLHVLTFIFFIAFILVHSYMGALGHTPMAHFKEMFTGYEDPEDDPSDS